MIVYREKRGIAPLILNFSTKWRWVVNFMPRPLYSRERTSVRWVEPKADLRVLKKREVFYR
jgi:hypothetical protein